MPGCCAHAFSSCSEQGLLLCAIRGLFIAVASLALSCAQLSATPWTAARQAPLSTPCPSRSPLQSRERGCLSWDSLPPGSDVGQHLNCLSSTNVHWRLEPGARVTPRARPPLQARLQSAAITAPASWPGNFNPHTQILSSQERLRAGWCHPQGGRRIKGTRAPPPAFPRNPRGRLGFPGPTQGEG